MMAIDYKTKEMRRFLVGLAQCEVTGVKVTPDERTMFVWIQHLGERPDNLLGDPANPRQFSFWPDGPSGGRPRSACLVITNDDWGKIGT